MDSSNLALNIPREAFELILGHPEWSARDKCAVESTCRAWRDLARASVASTATSLSISALYGLHWETKMDSLELWMRRRASSVRHLIYEHSQHRQYMDPGARKFFTLMAPSLTSLSLTVRKCSTSRQRGTSDLISLAWIPPLPALRRLDLTLHGDTKGWGITRWAPNLEEMTLHWDHGDYGLDQFERSVPALPPTLRKFAHIGCFEYVDCLIQPEWIVNLRSLSLNWPGWKHGGSGTTLRSAEAFRAEAALLQLTKLTELSINVSCFGDENYGRPTGAAAALRALSSLTGLRTLKLASISRSLGPFDLSPLTLLETLHLYGGVVWGLQDAPLLALTELALIVVQSNKDVPESGYPIPLCLKRPGIKRLILNSDSSRDDAFTSARWAERGDFAAMAQTLEEVVIVKTNWIAPLSEPSHEGSETVNVPLAVVTPAIAARPNGSLRLAVGDGSCWGMACLKSASVEDLQGARMEKPPKELLAEVTAWGWWRLQREPDRDEHDYYEGDYPDPTPDDLWGKPRTADNTAGGIDSTGVEPPDGVDYNTWKDYYIDYMNSI